MNLTSFLHGTSTETSGRPLGSVIVSLPADDVNHLVIPRSAWIDSNQRLTRREFVRKLSRHHTQSTEQQTLYPCPTAEGARNQVQHLGGAAREWQHAGYHLSSRTRLGSCSDRKCTR